MRLRLPTWIASTSPMIEDYVLERRKNVCAATVNRELATLRRLLRLAPEWKEINRVPKIRLLLVTSINHLHQKARAIVGLGRDFVIHSLRHTMLTRLGESGVNAFTIMRIAGHSSIAVSQRYVHRRLRLWNAPSSVCSFREIRVKSSQKCCYRLQISLQLARQHL